MLTAASRALSGGRCIAGRDLDLRIRDMDRRGMARHGIHLNGANIGRNGKGQALGFSPCLYTTYLPYGLRSMNEPLRSILERVRFRLSVLITLRPLTWSSLAPPFLIC